MQLLSNVLLSETQVREEKETHRYIRLSTVGPLSNYICAAQQLLRKQYVTSGMQDTMCHKWELQVDDFVEILNVQNKHWTLVSNINCQPGEVNIYDNLLMSSSSVHKAILSKMKVKTNIITTRLKMLKV